MGLFERYAGRSLLPPIGLVWLAVVVLYLMIDGLREMRYQSAGYGPLETLWYLGLTIPRRAYQVFPFAALLGTVLGLHRLAARRELIAAAIAGARPARLVPPLVAVLMLAAVPALLFGEGLSADFEMKARTYRLRAITGLVSLAGPGGLWLRDGRTVIHIDQPLLDTAGDPDFRQVELFQLDEKERLTTWIRAARAQLDAAGWILSAGERTAIGEDGIHRESFSRLSWPTRLIPGTLGIAVLRPSLLGIRHLLPVLDYLHNNQLDDRHYRMALWERWFYPLHTLAAALLALPLAGRGRPQGGRGQILLAALGLGIGWFVVQRLTQGVAMAMGWPPPIAVGLPLILAAAAYRLLAR